MKAKKSNLFVSLLIVCYAISLIFSYLRIYVFHAYPIYYTEEEMPGPLDLLSDIPSLWNR
jgi:hypothetical protein